MQNTNNISENKYKNEVEYYFFKNKNLGPEDDYQADCHDLKDICKKFVEEYKELDVQTAFYPSSTNRFEQFKKLVINNYGKKIPPIKIAQIVLCGLCLEKNYIKSLIEVMNVSKRYQSLLEDSLKNEMPITSYCFKEGYSSNFSYQNLSSMDPQTAAFFIKYFFVVESTIKAKRNLNFSIIEELKNYWKHENPTLALEAKKLYYHLSADILEIMFYRTELHQFTLGNSHYGLHFVNVSELHSRCMPEFTPLLLKNISPIGTKAFANYGSILLSLNAFETIKEDPKNFLHRLGALQNIETRNKISKIVDDYLNIQSKQEDMYQVVYTDWLQNKKNMFRNKVSTHEFSHLECWSQTHLKDSDPHPPLPQSIRETLISEENCSIDTTFSLIQEKKETSPEEVNIISNIKPKKNTSTPVRPKKNKPKSGKNRTKKTETSNQPKTSTTKPSTPTFKLEVRSKEEEEVHQLQLKSPFKKVFRLRRWENLTDSIPKNEQFQEYVKLDEENQVNQIKRHDFCYDVDKLLYDKRYTIKTEKGSHLLAHVQFDQQDKQSTEFSVISYAFNSEKKMYHRYIHTFGTQIFHSDLSKNIEKIKISDSPIETVNEETKQKSSEGTEIQFDPCSQVFIFRDKVRQMTITVFPVPENK